MRSVTVALAGVTAALGVALIAVTIARGSGVAGIFFGCLFIAAGGGRLYLARGRSR